MACKDKPPTTPLMPHRFPAPCTVEKIPGGSKVLDNDSLMSIRARQRTPPISPGC